MIKAQSLIICVFWACFYYFFFFQKYLSVDRVERRFLYFTVPVVVVSLFLSSPSVCVCVCLRVRARSNYKYMSYNNNRCSWSTGQTANYGLHVPIGQPLLGAQSQFTRQSHQPLHHPYQVINVICSPFTNIYAVCLDDYVVLLLYVDGHFGLCLSRTKKTKKKRHSITTHFNWHLVVNVEIYTRTPGHLSIYTHNMSRRIIFPFYFIFIAQNSLFFI
jgi:hypothetical protein